MRFVQKTLFIYTVLYLVLAGQPALAVVVSADTSGGYGGQVLDILMQSWVRPEGASGSASVLVRITTDGRPFSCELRKSSGQSFIDDSICLAVAKAGIFPPTPMGMPAEVALTFVFDNTGTAAIPSPTMPIPTLADIPSPGAPAGAAPSTQPPSPSSPTPLPASPAPATSPNPSPASQLPASPAPAASSATLAVPAGGAASSTAYSDTIMANARPYVEIPQGLAGEYTATVSLTIAPDGTVLESRMDKPSGSAAFDAAILRALLTHGVIIPPYDGQQQNLFLNFAFKTQ